MEVLVDIVYVPKGSLLLIQACWNHQNFSRGQEVASEVGAKCQHDQTSVGKMVEVLFLQQFCVQFAQYYFTMLDARVSELFHSFRCSRGECLPSNSMCKPYVQKVEKLLKLESSISSIIQALALTSMTQAPSDAFRCISQDDIEPWNNFRIATSTSLLVSATTVFTINTLELSHIANLHFHVLSTNFILRH